MHVSLHKAVAFSLINYDSTLHILQKTEKEYSSHVAQEGCRPTVEKGGGGIL